MPTIYDIFKVGNRYQVFDMTDNSPIGTTFLTRTEAEGKMNELYNEEYEHHIFGDPLPPTPANTTEKITLEFGSRK